MARVSTGYRFSKKAEDRLVAGAPPSTVMPENKGLPD